MKSIVFPPQTVQIAGQDARLCVSLDHSDQVLENGMEEERKSGS